MATADRMAFFLGEGFLGLDGMIRINTRAGRFFQEQRETSWLKRMLAVISWQLRRACRDFLSATDTHRRTRTHTDGFFVGEERQLVFHRRGAEEVEGKPLFSAKGRGK